MSQDTLTNIHYSITAGISGELTITLVEIWNLDVMTQVVAKNAFLKITLSDGSTVFDNGYHYDHTESRALTFTNGWYRFSVRYSDYPEAWTDWYYIREGDYWENGVKFNNGGPTPPNPQL